MRRVSALTNVSSGDSLDRPELRIYPRRDLAVRFGVSTESLSQTVRVSTIGDVGPALAKFDAGDRLVPIRVHLRKGACRFKVLEQVRCPDASWGGACR